MLLLPCVLGRNDCRCGTEEITDGEDSSTANGNHEYQPARLLAALARRRAVSAVCDVSLVRARDRGPAVPHRTDRYVLPVLARTGPGAGAGQHTQTAGCGLNLDS